MCCAHPADQAGFSEIPAGIPFAARRLLSSVRGPALASVATAPSALKRSPIRTSSHTDKRSEQHRKIPFTSEFDMGPHHDGALAGQVEDLNRICRIPGN